MFGIHKSEPMTNVLLNQTWICKLALVDTIKDFICYLDFDDKFAAAKTAIFLAVNATLSEYASTSALVTSSSVVTVENQTWLEDPKSNHVYIKM